MNWAPISAPEVEARTPAVIGSREAWNFVGAQLRLYRTCVLRAAIRRQRTGNPFTTDLCMRERVRSQNSRQKNFGDFDFDLSLDGARQKGKQFSDEETAEKPQQETRCRNGQFCGITSAICPDRVCSSDSSTNDSERSRSTIAAWQWIQVNGPKDFLPCTQLELIPIKFDATSPYCGCVPRDHDKGISGHRLTSPFSTKLELSSHARDRLCIHSPMKIRQLSAVAAGQ